ncbi:hypothetical protein TNCV_3048551 [Trichonephila clavipes]|nr:hypothetical protein TNCV_3048551 [Trichonephila clavipes]
MLANANILLCRSVQADEIFLWNKLDSNSGTTCWKFLGNPRSVKNSTPVLHLEYTHDRQSAQATREEVCRFFFTSTMVPGVWICWTGYFVETCHEIQPFGCYEKRRLENVMKMLSTEMHGFAYHRKTEAGKTQRTVLNVRVVRSVISRLWNRFQETGNVGRRPRQGLHLLPLQMTQMFG